MGRREFEVTLAGPVRQSADDLCEVAFGLNAVKLAGSDQRVEVGGGLGVIVRAEEEPSFAPGGDGPEPQ